MNSRYSVPASLERLRNGVFDIDQRAKELFPEGSPSKHKMIPYARAAMIERYANTANGEFVFEQICARMAAAMAAIEVTSESKSEFDEFSLSVYEMLVSTKFFPAGRIAANLGAWRYGKNSKKVWKTVVPNCVVLEIPDDFEGIYETLKNAALLQRLGSGIGYNPDALRPRDSECMQGGDKASGPIEYIKVFSMALERGIRLDRKAANMAMFSVDHPQVMDFFRIKNEEGSKDDISNFNITVKMTDEFIAQATNPDHPKYGKPWITRFGDTIYEKLIFTAKTNEEHPSYVKGGQSFVGQTYQVEMSAKDMFRKLCEMAHHNGEPGFCFIDTVNRTNPVPGLGEIKTSNPCVTSDTWVMTKDGPRQVTDLLSGSFETIVHGIPRFSTAFFNTGIEEVFRIETKEGYMVTATGNHRFQGIDGKWIQVSDLVKGDGLFLHRHTTDLSWVGEGTCDEGLEYGKRELPISEKRTSSDFQLGYLVGLFREKEVSVAWDGCAILVKNPIFIQRMLLRFGFMSEINISNGIRTITIPAHSVARFCKKICSFKGAEQFLENDFYTKKHPLFQATVSFVESVGMRDVYDCKVTATPTFDANGFVSHNCGEQFLHNGDQCCLGSFNVAEFVKIDEESGKPELDEAELFQCARLATRFMDNVISVTEPPVDIVRDTVEGNRRIGLGIMGLADAMMKAEVSYGKKESRVFAKRIARCIQKGAEEETKLLAQERGAFPNFHLSVFAEENGGDGIPRRNCALTNCPPTGTSSTVCGATFGIEPLMAHNFSYGMASLSANKGTQFYKNYMKSLEMSVYEEDQELLNCMRNDNLHDFSRTSSVRDLLVKALEKHGLAQNEELLSVLRYQKTTSLQHLDLPEEIKRVFRVSGDLTIKEHIKIQAAIQEEFDNAISKTCNMPSRATVEDVMEVIPEAHKRGIKGLTIYRNHSRKEEVIIIDDHELSSSPSSSSSSSSSGNPESEEEEMNLFQEDGSPLMLCHIRGGNCE